MYVMSSSTTLLLVSRTACFSDLCSSAAIRWRKLGELVTNFLKLKPPSANIPLAKVYNWYASFSPSAPYVTSST